MKQCHQHRAQGKQTEKVGIPPAIQIEIWQVVHRRAHKVHEVCPINRQNAVDVQRGQHKGQQKDDVSAERLGPKALAVPDGRYSENHSSPP